MGNISVAKIIVILVVALVVLGPERLPPLLRQAGRWLGEFRRLRETLEEEMKGALGDLPNPIGAGDGSGTAMANPVAGLRESLTGVGESIRSAMAYGPTPITSVGTAVQAGDQPAGLAENGTVRGARGGDLPGATSRAVRETSTGEAFPDDPSLN